MNYEEKYKRAIDRAVNLFVINNISATAGSVSLQGWRKIQRTGFTGKKGGTHE